MQAGGNAVMSMKKTAKVYQKPTDYFSDFPEWPTHWRVTDDDLAIGQGLLTWFEPFIATLIKDGRAVKTITHHMANLTILGAEIIQRLNDDDESHRTLSPRALLLEYVSEEGGPLVHAWDPNDRIEEAYQKSFNATCRKLFKFVSAST